MNRKSFIRNTLLGLCASLLPEVLRPNGVFNKKPLVSKSFEWSYIYYTGGVYYYDSGNRVFVEIDKSLLPAKTK